MQEALNNLAGVLQILVATDSGRVVTIVSALIIFGGLYFSYKLIGEHGDNVQLWQKFVAIFLIVFGVAFFSAGSSLILYNTGVSNALASGIIMGTSQRAQNLKENKKASWLIRFITYSDNTPEKQIGKLEFLGLKN